MPARRCEDLAHLNVLLLEQEGEMRGILCAVIASFGFERVHRFGAVDAAMEAARQIHIDVAVVDHELVEGSGLDFVKALRSEPARAVRSTPVVMLTGQPSVALIRSFVEAGVDEVLAKPIRPDTLYEHIAGVIRRPRTYVEAAGFFGPDRRRTANTFHGPDRRDRKAGLAS